MRISRGLFRLWLVASVVWIGGVGVMTLPAGALADLNPLPSGFVGEKPPFDPYKPFLPLAPWIEAQRAQVREAVFSALIPPGVLLALGAALAWAFRGFRA
jgi:hypothetical protein